MWSKGEDRRPEATNFWLQYCLGEGSDFGRIHPKSLVVKRASSQNDV